jgi:hypothetical protein
MPQVRAALALDFMVNKNVGETELRKNNVDIEANGQCLQK